MDDTLGIDCPQSYEFNKSHLHNTPSRLSAAFDHGTVGESPPRKRIKQDLEESFRPMTRSQSTPRRSARLKKAKKTFTAATVTIPISQPPKKFQARPPQGTFAKLDAPKPNRTVELRKQAALNKMKPKQKQSNAVVMKPNFQKPKLTCTVPKTPEMMRRLRAHIKRQPPMHVKSHVQKEEEEVENMKNYKFKAAPVPRAVRVPKELPLRVKSEKPPTKTVTPNITKGKKRKYAEVSTAKDFKANPVPQFSRRSAIVRAEKKPIETVPFSFDKRYADPNANRKKMIETEIQKLKDMTKFTATPYHGFGSNSAKENKKPSSRALKGSNYVLPGDAISKKKQEIFQKKVEEEKEKLKALANFKASSVKSKFRPTAASRP